MKKLLAVILLLRLGTDILINPEAISYLEPAYPKYSRHHPAHHDVRGDELGTYIHFKGTMESVFSQWMPEQIKEAIDKKK